MRLLNLVPVTFEPRLNAEDYLGRIRDVFNVESAEDVRRVWYMECLVRLPAPTRSPQLYHSLQAIVNTRNHKRDAAPYYSLIQPQFAF